MRTLGRGLGLIAIVGGCAGVQPATDASPPPPAFAAHEPLQAPADYADAADDAAVAMEWLIRTTPQESEPARWKVARDLALDWIDGTEEPRLTVSMPIIEPVESEKRFTYAPYMRMAYLCGKTRYLLDHPSHAATAVAAEVAGIEAMLTLYAATLASSDPSHSRALRRYARKRDKGKLTAYVGKLVGR